MTTAKPAFRRMINGMSGGEVLKPIIEAYLYDPKFPSFSIDIEGWKPKPPDGWFHPSTHPLMDERVLYHYLAHPKSLIPEVFDLTSTMTVTQGHFWHEFIQMVGLDSGFLLPSPTPTPGRNLAEWGFSHPETLSRGHVDGVTNSVMCSDEEIFEFKTMRGPKAAKIATGRPDMREVQDSFKALVPGYYAQAQEYLRISGRRRWRAIILSLEWPFPMREIVLDADPFFQHEIAAKYRRVIEAVRINQTPISCCGKFSDCIARGICSVAAARR